MRSQAEEGVLVGNFRTVSLLFADDLVLLAKFKVTEMRNNISMVLRQKAVDRSLNGEWVAAQSKEVHVSQDLIPNTGKMEHEMHRQFGAASAVPDYCCEKWEEL